MSSLALEAYETEQYFTAMSLAGWGLDVGPLLPPDSKYKAAGKRPMWGMSFEDFTTDEHQITAWWKKCPKANVGGRPPAFAVVLDVDVRSGGMETWAEINQGHALPHTLVTETGSGGLHVWFRLPYRGDLSGQAGQGIDIKHHGGLLVMPGSIHPDTGQRYVCISWCPPADLPVLPVHLRRHVYKPAKPIRPIMPPALVKQGDGGYLVKKLLDAPPGTRNDTLNDVLFQAYTFGYEHRVPELLDAAETIGLDATEIENTHRSAQQAAERKVA